jgi:amidophosphoribosyltransferase
LGITVLYLLLLKTQTVLKISIGGQVGNTFASHELETFKGNMGIGHVSLKERQPMMWQGAVGEIAVAFSGNIINSEAREKCGYRDFYAG